MEKANRKLNQHYVWQAYLRAWTIDGNLWCLRSGKLYPSSTRNVGSERLFYALPDLTPIDLDFIEKAAIDKSPDALKSGHREHLEMYTGPWNLRRFVENNPDIDPELRSFVLMKLEEEIANAEENYHNDIEDAFLPILELLRAGNATFYERDDDVIDFLHAISTQYFRTRNVKENVIAAVKIPNDMIRRIWSPLSHIFAVNVGSSFYRERRLHKIVLLDNVSGTSFIAGDQPIINLHATPFDNIPPTELEFYYPLTPTKAMFFLKASNPTESGILSSPDEVRRYNILIAQNSHEQIFADSREGLEAMLEYVEEPLLQ
jgi:Protein of unknown function (DUF4238)